MDKNSALAVLKRLSPYVIIALLLFGFVDQFLEKQILFEKIRKIGWEFIAPQIALDLLYCTINGYVGFLTLNAFNIKQPFKEWFGLSFVNTLFNYLLPFKVGTVVKATYLKKKYDFAISHSASILVFATLVGFQSLFLLSAIIFTVIRFYSFNETSTLVPMIDTKSLNLLMIFTWGVFTFSVIFLIALTYCRIPKPVHHSPIVNRLINIITLGSEGLSYLLKNKKTFSLILFSVFMEESEVLLLH